jgi:hypothetical protein
VLLPGKRPMKPLVAVKLVSVPSSVPSKGKYSESLALTPMYAASEGTQKTILDDIQNSGLRDFEKLEHAERYPQNLGC